MPDREEDAASAGSRARRLGQVGDLDPVVAGLPAPRGRSRRRRGTPAARQACSAWAPICSEWMGRVDHPIDAALGQNRARPPAPPNPPIRTSPGQSRRRVRPRAS